MSGADELALLLTLFVFSASAALWAVFAMRARVRLTEPYLSGEPAGEGLIAVQEPSEGLAGELRRVYEAVYERFQTGYWGDWLVVSLPILALLLALFLAAAVLGGW